MRLRLGGVLGYGGQHATIGGGREEVGFVEINGEVND